MNTERWASIATPLEEFAAGQTGTVAQALEHVRQYVPDATPDEIVKVARDLADRGLVRLTAMSRGGVT